MSPFGNSNEVGYANSFGLALAIAFALQGPQVIRVACVAALAMLGATLVLSYSRGGFVAAAAGMLTFVALHARREWSRQERRLALAVGAACAIAGAAAYPAFIQARLDSSLPPPDPVYKAQDVGGWDGSADRLPSRAPRLHNQAGGNVLVVATRRSGEGVSYPIGDVAPTNVYEVHFEALAEDRPLPFSFGVARNQTGAGNAPRTVVLTQRWKPLVARWRPTDSSRNAGIISGKTADVPHSRSETSSFPYGVRRPAVSGKSRCASAARLISENFATETERSASTSNLGSTPLSWRCGASVRTRWRGLASIRSLPTRKATLPYGQLATHNEFLRVLVELGLIGVGLSRFRGSWGRSGGPANAIRA